MDWLKKTTIFILVAGALCSHVFAAEITFETPTNTIAVGDTLVFHIHLNTDEASINAVDLGVLYPGNLTVKNISKTNSFIQIWLKEPSYTKDAIFVSGGVPGGVNSADSIVATIIFEATAVGDGALGLSPASSILLNDGSGTKAAISLRTQTIHVTARKANQTPRTAVQDVSVTQTKTDFTSPRGFTPLIGNDTKLFGGKYFVSFFSSDSGSGIDHYELKEGNGPYRIARSPYVLEDQTLHSVIHIKAYDAAGNVRQETYPGIFKRLWWWISTYLGKLRS
jgi:hypothetical protein